MYLKFIHAADLHLGSPFKGLTDLPANIRDTVVQSTYKAFDRLVETAIHENVDFVLLAGDIYDEAHRHIRAQIHFKNGMQRLNEHNICAYIIHGNHDPLEGGYLAVSLPPNCHVFQSGDVQTIPHERDGKIVASISGISYSTAKEERNLALKFPNVNNKGTYAIGLLHTNCDGAQGHGDYAPCSVSDLMKIGMDYWALGHVHTRRQLSVSPPIVYPGNIQGRHINEQGERGFYIVQVNRQSHDSYKTELTFQPVQHLQWMEHRTDFTGIRTITEMIDVLDEERQFLRHDVKRSAIVRIVGIGETPLAEHFVRADVCAELLTEWKAKESEHSRMFIWPESFRFKGYSTAERLELIQSESIYADVLKLAATLQHDEHMREEVLADVISELYDHPMMKKYLSPLSEMEQCELIKEAEQLMMATWLGGESK